jgi:hypothetical protein
VRFKSPRKRLRRRRYSERLLEPFMSSDCAKILLMVKLARIIHGVRSDEQASSVAANRYLTWLRMPDRASSQSSSEKIPLAKQRPCRRNVLLTCPLSTRLTHRTHTLPTLSLGRESSGLALAHHERIPDIWPVALSPSKGS